MATEEDDFFFRPQKFVSYSLCLAYHALSRFLNAPLYWTDSAAEAILMESGQSIAHARARMQHENIFNYVSLLNISKQTYVIVN